MSEQEAASHARRAGARGRGRRTGEDDGGDDGRELARQRQAQHAAHRARQAQLGKLAHELRQGMQTVDKAVSCHCVIVCGRCRALATRMCRRKVFLWYTVSQEDLPATCSRALDMLKTRLSREL